MTCSRKPHPVSWILASPLALLAVTTLDEGSARGSSSEDSAAGEASDTSPSPGPLDAFYGTGHYGVAINVPAFRALAPQLGLSYDSSARDGLVGVGWRLSGISTIERASLGNGAPTFASDTYFLDGIELKSCSAPAAVSNQAACYPTGFVGPIPGGAQACSPVVTTLAGTSGNGISCTSGGNYATKLESYTRVVFKDNNWTITRKDGTTLLYAPIVAASPASKGALRWGLASVTDTHGNRAEYNWLPERAGSPSIQSGSHIDSIVYNGTIIKFYTETRPDSFTAATGDGLATSNQRLKTIDVSVDGHRLRTYALSYTSNALTGRSLLASVQQLGRDAIVATTNGDAHGGTAAPPSTFRYTSADDGTFTQAVADAGYPVSVPRLRTGDFDGDGKTDVLDPVNGTDTVRVWLSNGDGTFRVTTFSLRPGYKINSANMVVGDVNGDGKADIIHLLIGPAGAAANAWISNGDGTFALHAVTSGASLVADVNGDGLEDLIGTSSGCAPSSWLANGDGTFTSHRTELLCAQSESLHRWAPRRCQHDAGNHGRRHALAANALCLRRSKNVEREAAEGRCHRHVSMGKPERFLRCEQSNLRHLG